MCCWYLDCYLKYHGTIQTFNVDEDLWNTEILVHLSTQCAFWRIPVKSMLLLYRIPMWILMCAQEGQIIWKCFILNNLRCLFHWSFILLNRNEISLWFAPFLPAWRLISFINTQTSNCLLPPVSHKRHLSLKYPQNLIDSKNFNFLTIDFSELTFLLLT